MDIFLISALLLGLILGSFISAVIYRVPREISLTMPLRSICPHCEKSLPWYDNIPLLSWLLLGGKCRECRHPISGRYPLVELLGAAAGAASYIHFGVTPTAFVIFALLLALIAITFIDFEFRIIPDVISIPGIALGLLLGIAAQFTEYFPCHFSTCVLTQSAWDSLLGFLFGAGFFEAVGLIYERIAKREGIGYGDVKLLGMTGAILGWRSVAPTIFVGSVIGAVVGIVVMLMSGTGRKTEIAFGPWLSVGAVIYIFGNLPFLRF
jgi:leader peptidase (prepilin peptidase) / N-methyltransferase